MAHEVDMNFQDFGVLNSLYDSSLRYMDSRIGELINHLEEFNLMESTLSILLADHGENLGERRWTINIPYMRHLSMFP